MIQKLIRCIECNEVIPDMEDYEESAFLPGVEWSSEAQMRQNRFFHSHKEHRREELRVIPETHVYSRQTVGGLGTSFFKASNGKRKFLIRRTKSGFDQAARYEILSGGMRLRNESLKIQEEDLRRQIFADCGGRPLTQEKVERFIEVFREGVKTIVPGKALTDLEIAEGEDSLVAYGTLKKSAWKKILTRCRPDFEEGEMTALRKFILENNEPDDVLALRIQRKISFVPSHKETRRVKAARVRDAEAGV